MSVVSSLPERRIPINDLSGVCQGNSLAVLIGHNKVSRYRPHSKPSPPPSPHTILERPPSVGGRGPLIPIDRDFEGSLMADNLAHPHNRRKSLVVHWHRLPTTTS